MGFVYLIASSTNGPTKIGHSAKPLTRKGELQVGNPQELFVFHRFHCEDAEHLERLLHIRFESRRIRGEWFSVSVKEAAEAATGYGNGNSVSDFDCVQTHRSSPFDVRQVRRGQQHPAASRGEDVPRRSTAFDSSRRQPLLDVVRGKHKECLPPVLREERQDDRPGDGELRHYHAVRDPDLR